MSDQLTRCAWAKKPLDILYHDREWGVPLKDEQQLFEFLILEGVQAGLSWSTVLQRREAYRKAYDHFDPQLVATYSEQKVHELLSNPALIRNRLKILASVKNAQAFLQTQQAHGSFSQYLWSFVDHTPIINCWQTADQIPSVTALSQALSKALKKSGFSFVGPTICYALMQATGLVNDHLTTCFRHSELS